ncbi:MAG: glycosyltransferase, partial [Fibrobacter sp.]|nr:glycosyltransferase [Fibrobacter sp.]
EQIDSIFAQKEVQVFVYVRDDGSKDGTVGILEECARRYPNLSYERGKNLGFAKSFLTALKNAPKADFYAFSDQDDVWFDLKLKKTIDLLKNKRMCMAFCNAWNTDDNLKNGVLHYRERKNLLYKGMCFTDSVCSGFLMVFDEDVRDKAILALDEVFISHDLWVGSIVSFLGTIDYIAEPLAFHRRLTNSVSRNHFFKTLVYRLNTLFKGDCKSRRCAELMLKFYKDELSESSKQLLYDMAVYTENFAAKVRLLKNKNLRYGSFGGRFTIALKILLNKF